MTVQSLRPALFVAAILLTGACSAPSDGQDKAEAPASAPAPAPEATPAPLPEIDLENARQYIVAESRLTPLTFDRTGSTTVQDKVSGDSGPVYAVPVAAGQTLTAVLAPVGTNLYFNLSDAADHSGAALHRGEVDGNTATLKADRPMTVIITPFQPRASARRNEASSFSMTVSRD
jgi:hypothetical protein